MPSKNRVGCKQRADFFKQFVAQDLTFDGQATSLIVGQQNSFLANLFLENLILGTKVIDDDLLLAIDPAGQDDETQLPRPQNEVHGSPMLIVQRKSHSIDVIVAKVNRPRFGFCQIRKW